MTDELKGSAVTICHVDNTFTSVVTAARPEEVRERLNTLLVQTERTAFLNFEPVDTDQMFFFNLDQITYIQVEPTTLADVSAVVTTRMGASNGDHN